MKHLKNYWLMAGVLFCLVPVFSSCDDDKDKPSNEVRYNNIALTGAAEVQPTPVVTTGTGTLNVVYNKSTKIISYNVSWTLGNPADKTTGMHFHGPASLTESAGIIIPITLPNDNYTGSFSGQTRALTQAEEDQLLSGMWYLNIHSTTYPAGELRGQVD